ncbi:PH domain-containing protein [Roseiconus nitratireducens]|uniref:PH domain-containing protein n=1 Tax=Roseiconus nitratireducens TaxID=2605748 RepID=A0A5M6DLJ1_9BACT|nr:PH domain-containing protein [Roseiconus nitratireducens]KAA5547099.1 PH domain-containing protein [Roseiconus nitratireducens]
MADEKILWEAEFNPSVKTYWLLSGGLGLALSVIGLPLVPIWFLVGSLVTGRYLASHRCTLTNRNLKFAKGIFVRQEKTVPLDRITDLGLVQGPIMRALDLEALRVETAGQSSQGALVQLTGIKDGRNFRDAVLRQRDRVVGSDEERSTTSPTTTTSNASQDAAILIEIRDALLRMEKRLEERG